MRPVLRQLAYPFEAIYLLPTLQSCELDLGEINGHNSVLSMLESLSTPQNIKQVPDLRLDQS